MLEYRSLDETKNEIRLIKILPPTSMEDGAIVEGSRHEPVQCVLQYVSLDEYTPEYATFLETDAISASAANRALLWDHITSGDSQFVRMGVSSGHSSFRLLRAAFSAADRSPKYRDKQKNNACASRWIWGDFDALSYMWGDPAITRKVIVNGQQVDVTENLDSALRSLRDGLDKRKWQFIWIDALCINQIDRIERSIQVRRMKMIFEEAHTVCAWLQCETKETRSAFNFINKIARMTMTSPHKAVKHIDEVRRLQYVYDDSTWQGLFDLVRCRYWGRLWIVQELGLANMRATLVWGNQECLLYPWLTTVGVLMQDFYSLFTQKAQTIVQDLVEIELLQSRRTQFSLLIEISRSKFEGKIYPDMMAVLQTGRLAEAFDSRDKIYGLLGLIDPVVSEVVVPDYGAPESDVYRNFSRAAIKGTGKLDIICQVRSNAIRKDGCPSWVVDWSLLPQDLSGWNLRSKIFRASGDSEHVYKDDGNETNLVCQGLKVDTIDSLPHVFSSQSEPPQSASASRVSTKLSNPYKTDEDIKNALWQTLMLGQMDQLSSSVKAHLRLVPWFKKPPTEKAATALLYHQFYNFQQYNREIEVAGESLEHYFPKHSKNYVVQPGTLGTEIEKALQFTTTLIENKRLTKTRKGFLGLVPKNSQ